jgi:hypothetical protein
MADDENECEMSVWRIPPLEPRTSFAHINITQPSRTSPHENSTSTTQKIYRSDTVSEKILALRPNVCENIHVASDAYWSNPSFGEANSSGSHQRSESCTHIDILGVRGGQQGAISRYVCTGLPGSQDGWLPVLMDDNLIPNVTWNDEFPTHSIPMSHGWILMIMCNLATMTVRASLSRLPGFKQEKPHEVLDEIGTYTSGSIMNATTELLGTFTLCPLTGRACVVAPGGQVRVMDYLLPPPELV